MPGVSQYPSPYPPYPPAYGQPPVDFAYYQPAGDLLGPARRAAVLQCVLGGGLMVCCVGIGMFPWFANAEELVANSGLEIPTLPPGWTLQQMLRLAYGIIGGCGSLLGIILLILGFFVRRGSTGPVVASIIIDGLVGIVLVLNVVSGIVQAAGNPVALLGAAVLLVPLALFGLNVYWLMAAMRNTSAVNAARQQYQTQMYGFYQQQQAYAQSGQAYGPQAGAAQGYAYPPQPPYQQPMTPQQQQPYIAGPQPSQSQPSSSPPPPGPGDSDGPRATGQ